jgi:CheY-like chemotaxis protein
VVIVDLLMPGVDGFEFIARFRDLPGCRGVPIVVWTIKDLTKADHERLGDAISAIIHKSDGGGPDSILEVLRPFLGPTSPPGAADER